MLVIATELLDDAGLDMLRRHRHQWPATDLLLGWNKPSSDAFALAVRTQARGCIEWTTINAQLARALDSVLAGGVWFPRAMMQSMYLSLLEHSPKESAWAGVADSGPDPLTTRESEVLACMRRGMTNKQIAERLSISVNTVKKHLAHVYAKRGVRNGRQTST
jgi:DNA-binding NarL/FixJ family response regulator